MGKAAAAGLVSFGSIQEFLFAQASSKL